MVGLWRVEGALQRTVLAPRWICLLLLCVPPGCSDYGPPKNTDGLQNLQPVTGSVSFEGKPTPGAVVLFLPVDEPDKFTYRVAGTVDEDGAFEMQTSVPEGTRPGVAAGEYLVTISWNEPARDRDSDEGPDLVPPRYRDHRTSGLRVEIVEGNNELEPFDLKP